MKRFPLFIALFAVAFPLQLRAVPPLVSGDVPTAEKGNFEWYAGVTYLRESGMVSREFPPLTELVYGLTDRQEINLVMPYLSEDGVHGFEDAVIGTKYNFLKDSSSWPGMSLSFEAKLPSASTDRGLGTGEWDYDLLYRVQKKWGRFTLLGDLGYTFIGEPLVDGVREARDNVWFVSLAQFYELTSKTNLLSELYFETNEEPGQPDTLAANVGVEHELVENITLQAAVGTSLRENSGPDVRLYVGLDWEFEAPWKPALKRTSQ